MLVGRATLAAWPSRRRRSASSSAPAATAARRAASCTCTPSRWRLATSRPPGPASAARPSASGRCSTTSGSSCCPSRSALPMRRDRRRAPRRRRSRPRGARALRHRPRAGRRPAVPRVEHARGGRRRGGGTTAGRAAPPSPIARRLHPDRDGVVAMVAGREAEHELLEAALPPPAGPVRLRRGRAVGLPGAAPTGQLARPFGDGCKRHGGEDRLTQLPDRAGWMGAVRGGSRRSPRARSSSGHRRARSDQRRARHARRRLRADPARSRGRAARHRGPRRRRRDRVVRGAPASGRRGACGLDRAPRRRGVRAARRRRGGRELRRSRGRRCRAARRGRRLADPGDGRRSRRSMPSASTSRCVTARMRPAPSVPMRTPSASSAAQNAGASATPNTTMFVSTVARSIVIPSISASPSARRRALAWSSASRSTWWSSAYSPAAAIRRPGASRRPTSACSATLRRSARRSPPGRRRPARRGPW